MGDRLTYVNLPKRLADLHRPRIKRMWRRILKNVNEEVWV